MAQTISDRTREIWVDWLRDGRLRGSTILRGGPDDGRPYPEDWEADYPEEGFTSNPVQA